MIKEKAEQCVKLINRIIPDFKVKIMHVCGTHEQAITRAGLRALLPENLELLAGPGCPVCVVPAHDIDEVLFLGKDGKIITTYGDMIRVPASEISLADAKAEGANVKIVYSVNDAIKLAQKYPTKEVVFFGIGFETTAPTLAAEMIKGPPKNFSVLTSYRLIPPVMELVMGIGDLHVEGFICPGHVATVIGTKPFQFLPELYSMPTVIAGFEPLDILLAILMLLKQIRNNDPKVDNEYSRSVTDEGNIRAQEIMNEVFEIANVRWRGIGRVPLSGYHLKEEFSDYNARKKYNILINHSIDIRP
ncbi:MAG: hydrogenase formation protein HypD, partial [Candidatus Lokiarchaeota archaeon]|nr:hydrogenase formation protein HypD [Candidatus Lokiarchaeota archaeon]